MVVFSSLDGFAWIWLAQVGEPLADSIEGTLNRLNADRLVVAAFASADAHAVDEEVTEFVFLFRDVRQVRLMAEFEAEGRPLVPLGSLSEACFGDEGLPGDSKRSAEVSAEIVASVGCSCCQVVCCGCVCVM
jgi:hypothetical protein